PLTAVDASLGASVRECHQGPPAARTAVSPVAASALESPAAHSQRRQKRDAYGACGASRSPRDAGSGGASGATDGVFTVAGGNKPRTRPASTHLDSPSSRSWSLGPSRPSFTIAFRSPAETGPAS